MTVKIGLTGGIGCGKSAVGAVLRELGAEYADADRLVHELLAAGSPVLEQVAGRFGTEVLAADGGVDRKRLGAIVFGDRAALRDLEDLLHPAVRAELRRRMAASTAPAFVLDAIKLIEGGLYRDVDSVWVVTCEPAEQRRRLVELRGMAPAEAEARIAAQPPQAERLPYAQVVIANDGALADVRRQVEEAWGRVVETPE
jgi:dephospho-CoA kinase